jgi:UDP-glucose:(heptosyl)LPS alpha-1,3-glucosyltransferase
VAARSWVSRRCGVAELVQEGENGFVRDSLDAPSYAKLIDELASNPAQLALMRDKARATALEFTLKKMTVEYAALYQKLLSARGK